MANPTTDQEIREACENSEEWKKALRGELFHAFVPELVAARDRCGAACERFNITNDRSRRNMVKLWREIVMDSTPLPPPPASASSEPSAPATAATQSPPALTAAGVYSPSTDPFPNDPTVLPPIHIDYGLNVFLAAGVFVNFNATFIDSAPIRIGARTLVAPNCAFYAGTHPLDPAVRNGCDGPELGFGIEVGEDCWIGGNVIVLPGVKIGRGCTVGAGSVVTKDVPDFHVVAGNPARVLRKVETEMDKEGKGT